MYLEDGEIHKGDDEHFQAERHGCGGTVFIFREATPRPRIEESRTVAVEALAPGGNPAICDEGIDMITRQFLLDLEAFASSQDGMRAVRLRR